MAALLFRRRRADAPDMRRLRFEAGDEALDEAALAGGIPAVEADDDPAAGAQVMDLQIEQVALQLRQIVFVGLLVDRTVDHLDLVQDRPLAPCFLRCWIVSAPAGRRNDAGTLTARTARRSRPASGSRRTT